MVSNGHTVSTPSELTSALLTPEWILIGATVQGTHHLLEGTPCQDTQAFLSTSNCLVIAIADGVGSAVLAHQGAQLAVQSALANVAAALSDGIPENELDWRNLLQSAFFSARERLVDEADRQNLNLFDFATTLILVAVSKRWLAAANIGDGAVVIVDDHGSFLSVCKPQNGEFVNETNALTQSDANDRTDYQILQGSAKYLALLSDGLQRIALHQIDGSPHTPFFAPLFRQLDGVGDASQAAHSLANFLASEKVRKLSGDDKTLVLAANKYVDD